MTSGRVKTERLSAAVIAGTVLLAIGVTVTMVLLFTRVSASAHVESAEGPPFHCGSPVNALFSRDQPTFFGTTPPGAPSGTQLPALPEQCDQPLTERTFVAVIVVLLSAVPLVVALLVALRRLLRQTPSLVQRPPPG